MHEESRCLIGFKEFLKGKNIKNLLKVNIIMMIGLIFAGIISYFLIESQVNWIICLIVFLVLGFVLSSYYFGIIGNTITKYYENGVVEIKDVIGNPVVGAKIAINIAIYVFILLIIVYLSTYFLINAVKVHHVYKIPIYNGHSGVYSYEYTSFDDVNNDMLVYVGGFLGLLFTILEILLVFHFYAALSKYAKGKSFLSGLNIVDNIISVFKNPAPILGSMGFGMLVGYITYTILYLVLFLLTIVFPSISNVFENLTVNGSLSAFSIIVILSFAFVILTIYTYIFYSVVFGCAHALRDII